MERRLAHVQPPWWLPISIKIATSGEQALENHNNIAADPNNIIIYTDGSGIDGRIGLSAVYASQVSAGWVPLILQTRKAFLGTEREFIVYFGELWGIIMALEIIAKDDSNRPAIIFVDNQSAIKSSYRPRD